MPPRTAASEAADDAYATGIPARWYRRMTSGQRAVPDNL
jgi:hypothetical protein